MEKIIDEIISGGFDAPDSRDWLYSDFIEVGGSDNNKSKKKFPRDRLNVINQYKSPTTRKSCTQSSPLNISNGQNILEYKENGLTYKQKDIVPIWLEYNKKRLINKRGGDSLQNGLKNLKKIGLIEGYAKVRSIKEGKIAIDRGNYIATGSAKGDRRKVRVEKQYGLQDKYVGHMFCLVDYDDNRKKFIGINSLGNDNGFFELDYKYFDTLYSKYAVLDASDQEFIEKYKAENEYKMQIEKVIDLGLTNGERPKDPVTREEMRVTIGRMYDLLKNG